MSVNERFRWKTAGEANASNIVAGENYRFTVLTPRMIRMEYGKFTDLASQMAFYRDFPVNDFTVTNENGILTLETDALVLHYSCGEKFAKDTLFVELKNEPKSVWHFGDESEQLFGTVSTLDEVNGSIALGNGVCARCGYTYIDDSDTMLLSKDGWFELRKEGSVDWYFLGYGHDYRGCVADYYRLTGAPPLLPDYALGNWWSRYYKYTQDEYCELMERFKSENVPLSVAVVDMDWHITKTPKENWIDDKRFCDGWTGYTWNEEFFPNYKDFLKFLAKNNLKTALNLHPSNGIGSHEAMYSEMAKACGVDPKSKKLIKLDVLDPKFMENYFDILLHPYEEDGVNFWWMDWQQGTDYWWVHDEDHPASELEKMNPLWLLNHLHILDIERNGKRPMFFSRYCGLGAHRYPVGFSGDTIITWESLDFQPYFTATASNAGYCWWSHDIGGHMQGYRDDELMVRWIQLGVLSPINRLHSSNNLFSGKEPWNLGEPAKSVVEDWLRLRHNLFPYIYTMNYRCHNQLQAPVQPMYYEYPECEEAYSHKNQYFFGSEFFVAPITEKSDSCSLLGRTEVWFPEGSWVDVFNGFVYSGKTSVDVYRPLGQLPVFAKAGAIIPMQNNKDNRLGGSQDMTVLVFPGSDNSFTLYEDEGDGNAFENGAYALTDFTFAFEKGKAGLTVSAVKGKTKLVPSKRNWTFKFRGFAKDTCAKCSVNGKNVESESAYDKATSTLTVKILNVSTDSEIFIDLKSDEGNLITDNSYAENRIFDILMAAQMSYTQKQNIWNFINNGGYKMFYMCGEKQYKSLMGAINEMLGLQKQ